MIKIDGVQCERVFSGRENLEGKVMRNRSILIGVNRGIVDECVETIT